MIKSHSLKPNLCCSVFRFVRLSAASCSVFLLVFFGVAYAEGISPNLTVSPHTFELTVKRGQELNEIIRISNEGDVAISIAARVIDFTAQDETGLMEFDESSQDSADASRFWFTLENPNFILEPGETELVRLKLQVPEDVEPGGHYSLALFEPQLPSFYFKEGQSKAIPVLGVLFLFSVEVEGVSHSSDPFYVAEFSIPEQMHLKKLENFFKSFAGLFSEARAEEGGLSIVESSRLPFTLRIKNNDIFHVKPAGQLVITTLWGKKVGETEIKRTTILPGKIRKFPLEFKPELPAWMEKYLPSFAADFISRNLFLGKYRAELQLADGMRPGGATIKESIEFWAFPWKTVLAVIFAAMFIFLSRKKIVVFIKRIIAAVKALARGYRE